VERVKRVKKVASGGKREEGKVRARGGLGAGGGFF